MYWLRERTAIEYGIAFEIEALDRACLCVDVNPPVILIEDDIVNEAFCTGLILRIDAMPMAAIRGWPLPTVAEDQTAANLGTNRWRPSANS